MELHDISVLIIFGVLSVLLFFDKIPFDYYSWFVGAILAYFGVRLGLVAARRKVE